MESPIPYALAVLQDIFEGFNIIKLPDIHWYLKHVILAILKGLNSTQKHSYFFQLIAKDFMKDVKTVSSRAPGSPFPVKFGIWVP